MAHVEQLISDERAFLESLAATVPTPEQLNHWRSETVAQRKTRLGKELYKQMDGTVRYGAFKGQKLADNVWWSATDKASMLCGFYEIEVLETLRAVPAGRRRTFIDLGAADGFYAIGMVRSGFAERAICFEMSEQGRQVINHSAQANKVRDQIEIHGKAGANFLQETQRIDPSATTILIDVEGAEFDILTTKTLFDLRHCHIVMEVHNWIDDFEQKYIQLLHEAANYFELGTITAGARDPGQIKELDALSDDNRWLICSEGRPNLMRWLTMQPLAPQAVK